MTVTLHPYQKQAVRFALDGTRNHGGAGLFLDMGLGKTLISIAIMDIWHAHDPELKILVIAPLLPAYKTWVDELGRFSDMHHLDWAVACGKHMSEKQRRQAIERNATVTIINQENIAWLDRTYPHWPWRAMVIDELSGFKSSNAKRFRILKRRRADMDWVVGLTGTPAAKSLMDLWSQIYLLDGGRALGHTISAYRERWFTPGRHKGHVVYEWKPRPFAYQAIMNQIGPFCLTMLARDKLPALPRRTVIDHEIDCPKDTREAYETFLRDQYIELDGSKVSAVNAGVLVNKLTQFTAGCLYPDLKLDPEGTVTHLDDAKLDELQTIIDANPGEQILVFYQFKDELRRIRERWPDSMDVRDPGALDAWHGNRLTILAAHPASARFGLNLQHEGHVVVWLSLTWSLEDYLQANARLDRQGQTRPVQIHRILESDTVDMRKPLVLEGRANLQDMVMDELSRDKR